MEQKLMELKQRILEKAISVFQRRIGNPQLELF